MVIKCPICFMIQEHNHTPPRDKIMYMDHPCEECREKLDKEKEEKKKDKPNDTK